jgi:hypothetical protein
MMDRRAPSTGLALALVALIGCGGNPLKVGKGGTAGTGGDAGSGSAGSGTAGSGSAPDCSTLDEATCATRRDCEAALCPDCKGGLRFNGCVVRGTGGSCPPSCPPDCQALDETTCNASGDCQAEYCKGCQGRTFVGCSDPGGGFSCPAQSGCPAPPACSTLDAATCGTRADCHVGTCSTCGQVFSSCLGPNEEAACPQLSCPPPSSCAGVDIFGCNARPWCTPVQCPDCMGGQVYAGCVGAGEGISCAACPTSPCPFPVNIGCFSGAVCASATVQAVCVHGEWRCPVGAASTEHCPSPDGGLDVGAGQ